MISINSLNDLDKFAKQFSKTIVPGSTILLDGNLGAGKTTFVQFLCRHMGIEEQITSPTFALLNIYDASVPIYHYDFYRLNNENELDGIGFDESISDSNIVIIEWALKFPDRLPLDSDILFFTTSTGNRYIEHKKWTIEHLNQLQKK